MTEIPKEWKIVPHEAVAQINPGLGSSGHSDSLEVSFLPMKAVQEVTGKYDLSQIRRIGEVKKGFTPVIDGDVIFAKITPCMENGKIAIMYGLKNGIGFGSTEFHVSRPKAGVYPKYLFYYFVQSQFRENARRQMTGSAGQLRVPTEYFRNVDLPVAATEEQHQVIQKIEEVFSDLDNAIENLKKAQEQLRIYRLALLKYAFEGKLVEAVFDEATIEQIALSVTYGTSNKAEKSGSIPVLRMGDLCDGKIDYSNLKFYKNLDGLEDLLLKPGDLLFNRTNSAELVGKTSIFNGNPQYRQVTFASYLIRIRVDRNKTLPEYLNYWMNSPRAIIVKNELKNQQVGQANINGTKLKNIKFPLASSLKVQKVIVQEIESRFSVCDQLELTIETNLLKAESMRQSILKQAFEGKLTEEWRKRHKDLISGQNSAEALLKKIMAEKAALNGKAKRIKNYD